METIFLNHIWFVKHLPKPDKAMSKNDQVQETPYPLSKPVPSVVREPEEIFQSFAQLNKHITACLDKSTPPSWDGRWFDENIWMKYDVSDIVHHWLVHFMPYIMIMVREDILNAAEWLAEMVNSANTNDALCTSKAMNYAELCPGTTTKYKLKNYKKPNAGLSKLFWKLNWMDKHPSYPTIQYVKIVPYKVDSFCFWLGIAINITNCPDMNRCQDYLHQLCKFLQATRVICKMIQALNHNVSLPKYFYEFD